MRFYLINQSIESQEVPFFLFATFQGLVCHSAAFLIKVAQSFKGVCKIHFILQNFTFNQLRFHQTYRLTDALDPKFGKWGFAFRTTMHEGENFQSLVNGLIGQFQ